MGRAAAPGSVLGVGTEIHMVQRMAREHPEVTVVSLDPLICPCSTMFRIDGPHLAWVLESLVRGEVVNQITVDASTPPNGPGSRSSACSTSPEPALPEMSTAVFVSFATPALDLDWIPGDAEVVVVHNDASLDRASISRRHVIHLVAGSNLGFGAAVNLALTRVTTDRVVLCNPDIMLTTQHWDALTDAGPDDVVTVPLVDEHDQPTSVTSRYPTAASHLASGYRLGRFAPRGGRGRRVLTGGLGRWGRAHEESLRTAERRLATRRAMGLGRRALRRRRAPERDRGLRRPVLLVLRRHRSQPPLRPLVPDRACSRGRHAARCAPCRRQRRRPRLRSSRGGEPPARIRREVRARSARLVLAGVRGLTPCSGSGAIPRPVVKRVTVVSLGRDGAMGEVRRVASWRLLFEAAGAHVDELRLSPGRLPHLDGVAPVVTGRAAPERLAWSGAHLRTRLTELDPDVAVVVSARAFDPRAMAGRWTVVVDFVDSLSRSYRDRSEIATTRFERYGFRALSRAHERVERRLGDTPIRRVAAGAADARDLGAEWVPIVIDPSLLPLPADRTTDHDVLFFGTLRYPPNIDALERLARIWPTVQRARPATTALIAGSAPPPRVRALCAAQRWELHADFASLAEIAARARVAVAPLRRTAGIQIKVLDAACLALPQVATSAALRGYAPGFPLEPRDDDAAFAAEIIRLLEHPAEAEEQGADLVRHAQERYSVSAWIPWATSLLAG